MRAGMVIFIYSLLFTSLVSFFAYAIIPDDVRPQYFDNLISGIAMNLVGPQSLKLIFQAFIVVVAFSCSPGRSEYCHYRFQWRFESGQRRRSANGLVSCPSQKVWNDYRMINLIVFLQLATIIGSHGNVYVLGEPRFGVIWSFAFNALAILVLRFKDKSPREWKVPFNLKIGKTEIPFGLGIIALFLFSLAGVNLITKQVATVSGIFITAVFASIFFASERINEKRRSARETAGLGPVPLAAPGEDFHRDSGSTRGQHTLFGAGLQHARTRPQGFRVTHTGKQDLVVMTVQVIKGPGAGLPRDE